ncbi:ABC transporter ATP-binding protein, partial [Halogeometricum sp. CBA1124]|uniref:ABC transporter ATP-binding protein n=1 Tax=Halogeometricum sp. CBA1124 TaxID=2668071 RepID=UPI0018D21251
SPTAPSPSATRTSPRNRRRTATWRWCSTNYALYPHKTVRQNIRFPLRKTDLSDAEQTERIESTAALLDITDLLEKEPAALSGGQRQRVAIGRAIAREPSVLLMDEPLSNLDAKLRVRTRSELRSLQQRLGITTVYVTHDQEEAMSIADRIAIMNDGEIEQVGTPEEVYEDPTSAFIADFLGDPSMNLLPTDAARRSADDDALDAALAAAVPGEARRVGVRPENLYLVDDAGSVVGPDGPETTAAVHDCEVTVVEPIGRAYELTLSTPSGPVVVRARTVPDELRGEPRIGVTYDPDALYAFDEDGGRIR